jgi:hypothetical protein
MGDEFENTEILTGELLHDNNPIVWVEGTDGLVTEKVRSIILKSPIEFGKLINTLRISLKIYRYHGFEKTKKLIELYTYLNLDNGLFENNQSITYKYYSYLSDVIGKFEEYDYSNIVSNIDLLSQQISSLFENVKQFNGFIGRYNHFTWFLNKFNKMDEGDVVILIDKLKDTERIMNIDINIIENDYFTNSFRGSKPTFNFICFLIGLVHKKYSCLCVGIEEPYTNNSIYNYCEDQHYKEFFCKKIKKRSMSELGLSPEELTEDECRFIVSMI